MNIAEIRRKTFAARASNDAFLIKEFSNSSLKKYINKQIHKAAEKGESELWLDFYATKKLLLGYKYGVPTMSSAIHYYQNKGFEATSRRVPCSENIALVISWM